MTDRAARPDRRRLAPVRLIVVAVVVAAAAVAATGAAASASAASGQQTNAPHIIPDPNSGAEPKSATDRGGWAQWTVLGGIAAGIVLIGLSVRGESRRKRRIAVSRVGEPSEDA